jgi:hypothetical protein
MIEDLRTYHEERLDEATTAPPRMIDTDHGPVRWLVPEYPPGLPAPPSADTDWWHGGPAIEGDLVLASHTTGNPGPHIDTDPLWSDPTDRRDVVHVTDRRGLAAGYAALSDTPTLYRVAPLHWLALDPYYPFDRGFLCCRTPVARILERHPMTRDEAERSLRLARAHEALTLHRMLS